MCESVLLTCPNRALRYCVYAAAMAEFWLKDLLPRRPRLPGESLEFLESLEELRRAERRADASDDD